jgi:hypothetical protein
VTFFAKIDQKKEQFRCHRDHGQYVQRRPTPAWAPKNKKEYAEVQQ